MALVQLPNRSVKRQLCVHLEMMMAVVLSIEHKGCQSKTLCKDRRRREWWQWNKLPLFCVFILVEENCPQGNIGDLRFGTVQYNGICLRIPRHCAITIAVVTFLILLIFYLLHFSFSPYLKLAGRDENFFYCCCCCSLQCWSISS